MLPVNRIWGQLLMFKVVAEKILGGNDWIENILVAEYPKHLYKYFLIIKDISYKQRIYITLTHYFLDFCAEIL